MRTYGMSENQQDAVWLGFHAGESINSIAKGLLLPWHQVRRYLGQTGGIRPATVRRWPLRLSAAERDELSCGLVLAKLDGRKPKLPTSQRIIIPMIENR